MGDLLFTLTRLSARLGVVSEDVLWVANARFEGRFRDLEGSAISDGKKLKELSLQEMEVY